MKSNHEHYMRMAIDMAKQGWPKVAPNPLVGCVIVRNNEIVGRGYHHKFGGAHAEVNAVESLPANISAEECTLYVNLEPCSHHGKTPPCADMIIKKGFKKVVVANNDPNPLVSGKGLEKLKKAGIEVTEGILEAKARELNRRFFTFYEKKRPYFILKWAQTSDGFISRLPVPENREDNRIGNDAQQREVHRMRSEEMAIMVGKNTVLCDNPMLTTRLVPGRNPIRIFIDRNLEVPLHFNIYNKQAPTIIFNAISNKKQENLNWVQIDFKKNVLEQIARYLYDQKIQSVIIEGGSVLLTHFIEQKMYDEVKVFVNNDLTFNHGVRAPLIE